MSPRNLHVAAERGEPVAEAAVDPALRRPEDGERLLARVHVLELGAHQLAQDPAPAVRRQDTDDGHAGGACAPARNRSSRARTRLRRRRWLAVDGDVHAPLRHQHPADALLLRPKRSCRSSARSVRSASTRSSVRAVRISIRNLLQRRVVEHEAALGAVLGEAHRDDAVALDADDDALAERRVAHGVAGGEIRRGPRRRLRRARARCSPSRKRAAGARARSRPRGAPRGSGSGCGSRASPRASASPHASASAAPAPASARRTRAAAPPRCPAPRSSARAGRRPPPCRRGRPTRNSRPFALWSVISVTRLPSSASASWSEKSEICCRNSERLGVLGGRLVLERDAAELEQVLDAALRLDRPLGLERLQVAAPVEHLLQELGHGKLERAGHQGLEQPVHALDRLERARRRRRPARRGRAPRRGRCPARPRRPAGARSRRRRCHGAACWRCARARRRRTGCRSPGGRRRRP